MINVMLWNINKRNTFETVICDVVANENIDILLLVEADNVDDSLITSSSNLLREKSPVITDQINLTPRFYTNNNRFTLSHYNTNQNTKRMVFCFLEIPNNTIILLTGIHFPSKLFYEGETQKDIANSYIRWINEVEGTDKNTILFGDFNMNPFEYGMVGPKTFNATLSNKIAISGPRIFQTEEYEYFYNPMWNFMGDIDHNSGISKLPGSYYYHSTSDSRLVYWSVFDKVICRPPAIQYVDLSSIKYLEKSGSHTFVKINSAGEYQIDDLNYSDHVPLIFKIKT